MSNEKDGIKQVCCSFCGKSQSQVKRMVAGPGVYICDECVALCEEIIANDYVPKEIDFENVRLKQSLTNMLFPSTAQNARWQ